MALYIVQHGKSLPKEVDPEKGISEQGKEEATLIANVAKGYKVQVSDIFHSGKKRALQTAEIFASILNNKGQLRKAPGMNPMDDVKVFAREMVVNNNTMVVGHLPFLEKLISFLITGSEAYTLFKLQNAGIVCLDQKEESVSWFIKWALMPDIS